MPQNYFPFYIQDTIFDFLFLEEVREYYRAQVAPRLTFVMFSGGGVFTGRRSGLFEAPTG